MGKGSSYEREICRKLSLWFTNNERDDIFWRTAGSGARATTRSKKGKKTFGSDGDIQAQDPIGQSLIDLCSIEIKRGYSSDTFANLIDKPFGAAEQGYEKFINQAISSAQNSDAVGWLIIIKRDRREAIVIIPSYFYRMLRGKGMESVSLPRVYLEHICNGLEHRLNIFLLSNFLEKLKPIIIKKLAKLHKKNKIPKELFFDEFEEDLEILDTSRCPNCDENTLNLIKITGSDGAITQQWKCSDCGYVENT